MKFSVTGIWRYAIVIDSIMREGYKKGRCLGEGLSTNFEDRE